MRRGCSSLQERSLRAALVVAASTLACTHRNALDRIEDALPSPAGSAGASAVAGTPDPDPIVLGAGVPTLLAHTGEFVPYDVPAEPFEVIGQDFARAMRFAVGEHEDLPGDAGYYGLIEEPVARGDLLRAEFWMRCGAPAPGNTDCRSEVVFEQPDPPYLNGGLEFGFRVGAEWTLLTEAFLAADAYASGAMQLNFRLGYPHQTLEVGAVLLENYGSSLSLAELDQLDDAPFESVLDMESYSSWGDAVVTQKTGPAYPFGRATESRTGDVAFAAPEDSGYQASLQMPVKQGDLLLLVFWAACTQSASADTTCQSSVKFEETRSPYRVAGLEVPFVRLVQGYRQYFFPFRASGDHDQGRVKIGFRLGYPNQTIEFGPAHVRRYTSELSMANLLETRAPEQP